MSIKTALADLRASIESLIALAGGGSSTNTPTDQRGRVFRSKLSYYLTLAVLAFTWIAIGWAYSGTTAKAYDEELNIGYLLWVFGFWHFLAGVRIADIQHVVGVYLLGMPTIQVSGGFIVAPPGVFQTSKDSLETFEDEYPDEPQNIWGGDNAAVPEGKKPPIRIPFSDPQNAYPFAIDASGVRKGDPLHRRTTNPVFFIVRWRILDEFDFRRNINDRAKARDQIEDIGVSFLNENLTRMTPAVALLGLETINTHFEARLREKTAHWGIEIIDARIKLIELSHSLNKSIQSVAEADAEAEATVLTAEGEKKRLQLEGEGRAKAVKAEIQERTAGLKKMADDLKVEPAVIIAAETARAIGQSPSDKIIIGTHGFAELMGAGTAIADSFKKAKQVESSSS